MARIKASDDPEVEYDEIADELYEDDEGLYGLDLGVAGAVAALSAARCIPFSSCNGGAFGGRHLELYPLVAFYAREAHLQALLTAAEEAGCGLENGNNGCLVVFAGDVEALPNFATALIKRSSAFRALKLKSPPERKGSGRSSHKQLNLL